MKNIYLTLCLLMVSLVTFAQAPEKISYQAVVRNANDRLVTDKPIGMRISILKDNANGNSVYREEHLLRTNASGLVTLEIGTGTTTDNFSTIDWSNGNYFIKTEIDPRGGINYTITGTSQLLSVPYALHAKTADYVKNGDKDWLTTSDESPINLNQKVYRTGNVGIGIKDATAKLHVKGNIRFQNGTEGEGKVLTSNANGLATWETPASINDADADPTNEIQDISLTGTKLSISNGSTIDLSVIDTDTQLDEAAVDGFVANNGYLTTEVDGSVTNEIQDISLTGTKLSISNGSTIDLSVIDTDTQLDEAAVDGFVANNGYVTTEVDGSVTNEIQDISLTGTKLSISNGSTIDLSVIDTDTQLDEAAVDGFVANNGFLTTEVDGSVTNEIQDISLTGTKLSISNGSTIDLSVIDTDTQLDEAAVDTFVANNGYVTTEVDGSVTNEIQDISLTGTKLSISNGSTIDLSVIDTDTQLDEAAVDGFVANNGYVTTEVDGSVTNEIQDISLTGTKLSISNGSTIDLSVIDTDTKLNEAEVDAFVANNGYLRSVPSTVRSIVVTPSMINTFLGGARQGTIGDNMPCIIFPEAKDSKAMISLPTPSDYNGSPLSIKVLYSSNATSGDFAFSVPSRGFVVGDNITQNPEGGNLTLSTPTSPNQLVEATLQNFGMQKSNQSILNIMLRRMGDTPSDTVTGPLRIIAIVINYNTL